MWVFKNLLLILQGGTQFVAPSSPQRDGTHDSSDGWPNVKITIQKRVEDRIVSCPVDNTDPTTCNLQPIGLFTILHWVNSFGVVHSYDNITLRLMFCFTIIGKEKFRCNPCIANWHKVFFFFGSTIIDWLYFNNKLKTHAKFIA